jgi:hypothetical protein
LDDAKTYLLNLNAKSADVNALTKSLVMIMTDQFSDFKECMKKTLDEKFAEQATPIANQTSLIMDHTHKLSYALNQSCCVNQSSRPSDSRVFSIVLLKLEQHDTIGEEEKATYELAGVVLALMQIDTCYNPFGPNRS